MGMKKIIALALVATMTPVAASAVTTTVSYSDGGGMVTLADGDELVIAENAAAPPNPLDFAYSISTTGPGTITIDNGPFNLFGEFDNFEMVLSATDLAYANGTFGTTGVLETIVASFTDGGQPEEFGAFTGSFDVPTELPMTFFINIGYDFGKSPFNETTISFVAEGPMMPVPVPASALLLISAVAGLGFVSRKRA